MMEEMKPFSSLKAAIEAGANTGAFELDGAPWVWRLFGDVCEARPQWSNFWIPTAETPNTGPVAGATVDWSLPAKLYLAGRRSG